MPANVAALDIAKDIYKAAYDGLNNDNWFLAQLRKDDESLDGLVAVHNVHLRRSSGVGAMAEQDTLATAGNQGYRKLRVPLRMLHGRVEVTVATMKLLGASDAAFVDGAAAEMEGNQQDLMRDVARQVWGTSNGVIATCGTTSSSTTVQLLASTSAVQMRQLWFDGGMVVDIGTVASPATVASARTVTDFNETNKTITISGAAVSTTSGTHFVFRTGAGGASNNSGNFGDGQKELTGFQTAVSTSATLHALAPGTETQWRGNVFANGGTLRDVSEPLINNAIFKTAINTGAVTEFMACSEEVHQSIAQLYTHLRRSMDNVNLQGGYTGIKWTTPVVGNKDSSNVSAIALDFDCPANTINGFNSDSFVFYMHPDGFSWMDEDGAVWNRVANKASYEATIIGFCELGVTKRRDLWQIADVNGITA